MIKGFLFDVLAVPEARIKAGKSIFYSSCILPPLKYWFSIFHFLPTIDFQHALNYICDLAKNEIRTSVAIFDALVQHIYHHVCDHVRLMQSLIKNTTRSFSPRLRDAHFWHFIIIWYPYNDNQVYYTVINGFGTHTRTEWKGNELWPLFISSRFLKVR